jgi:hypothetical protein
MVIDLSPKSTGKYRIVATMEGSNHELVRMQRGRRHSSPEAAFNEAVRVSHNGGKDVEVINTSTGQRWFIN